MSNNSCCKSNVFQQLYFLLREVHCCGKAGEDIVAETPPNPPHHEPVLILEITLELDMEALLFKQMSLVTPLCQSKLSDWNYN